MKIFFFAAILLLSAILLAAPNAAAQTAAELERVLSLPAVNYGDAAWIVLGAAGLPALAEDSTGGAYRFAADNKWLPQKTAAETPVTLEGLSLLIMKAFDMGGGLMYTLFPGPRYAYRELVYRKIIQGRSYSALTVSGERLLRILSRALDYSGDTASLAKEAAQHQLQEEVRASLNTSAQKQEGVSTGVEEILEYDNEFIPESATSP
jgi:hypothetical protein